MKKAAALVVFLVMTVLCTVSLPARDSREIYEVYLQYTGIRTEMPGIPDVEAAINEISVPAIGVRIHIVPVFIGDLAADTAYAIAGGEKIDIVNVGLTNNLTTMVSENLLLPLDDLLAERGQAAAQVTEPVSAAQKIGGITYAVSQYPYAARCSGFRYRKSMAEELGIDMHDGMTIDELGEAGDLLKEHGIFLTSVGMSSSPSYQFFCSMELFGESGACGTILQPADSAQIVNMYASEELREYYQTIRGWFESGYLPDDPMLSELDTIRLYNEKKLFGVPTNVTAGQMGAAGGHHEDVAIVRLSEPVILTSSVDEFMLGIASTCRNPEAAMDFINLIYTNPEVADLLNYGVEGLDYVAVPGTEHVITTDGTENENGSRFGSGFVRFGDPLSGKIMYPLTDDYYGELVQWETSARRSLSFGYSFDASDYAVEARNIARILDEYLPILNVGMAADVEKELDELQTKLDEAGMGKIIEANNTQLQEYLAASQTETTVLP